MKMWQLDIDHDLHLRIVNSSPIVGDSTIKAPTRVGKEDVAKAMDEKSREALIQ